MSTTLHENVDYRLLNKLSKLVICSRCLQRGTVTPVPQVISPDRKITNVCTRCRVANGADGLHKLGHMRAEHGEGVDLMRLIKNALDPHGLMNPGKLLPEA